MSSEAISSKPKTDAISKMNIQKNTPSKTNIHKVTKTIVTSPNIYKPVGPYSQAILADKTLYVSGVLGMDHDAQLVCGGAEAQARQALDNLRHVLEAGGASLESVVKTTILLGSMDDFQVVNQVYAEYFQQNCPARATYQVGRLPMGAAIEIEAIALSGDLVISHADFPKDYPARATYQVGKLPLDAAVEIEAIALSGDLVVAEAGPCPCARQ